MELSYCISMNPCLHIHNLYSMKQTLIIFVSLVCLLPSIQCYDDRHRDPLGRLLKPHMGKISRGFFVEESASTDTDEYSPVYVAPQDGLKEYDKILGLPGQPQVSFSQYSGYVTVDPKAGRALFYWLTESNDSDTKPLVLWLNGGPGCSSIGLGAMTELGPFRANPDGKTLWYNENAWNNVANVLFLESPAGVGFSYSNTSSDYTTGDTKTAANSYTFLINWLDRFPEYKTRDFYMTGESYAGHFVPQLAQLNLKNNKITNQTVINLKGIALGNAYIDTMDAIRGWFDYLWSHAVLSDEHHDAIIQNCNFSSYSTITEKCIEAMHSADGDLGDLYPYDIYAPWCGSNSTAPWPSSFDQCSIEYVFSYLNLPEVQKALHANVTGIPGPWESCSSTIVNNWNDNAQTVLPVIKELMASGISIWIYSGDTDRAETVTATRYSINKLGPPVKTPWYPWYHQGEVGGYAVEYENITFVTVRGSGHLVPSYQPERALAFFSSFLEGKLPPSS